MKEYRRVYYTILKIRVMKKMSSSTTKQSWLSAIAEIASAQKVSFPSFTGHAMGAARTATIESGRFVTFKRRLVPATQAEADGIEWTLWLEENDLPLAIAAFREPLVPDHEAVTTAFSLLKGWLIEGWTPDETREAVKTHIDSRCPSSG